MPDWMSSSLFDQAVLLVFISAVLVQLLYFLGLFVRIPFHHSPPSTSKSDGITVIICARNEEKHLRELIPIIMEQDHPNFELIVVNDNSWDSSGETLKAFAVTYPHLHIIELSEEKQRMTGKKIALTLGMKAAKNDIVLMTDADCRPASSLWIKHMTSPLTHSAEINLGYSPFNKEPGLLNALIRFDGFQIGLFYLSMAKSGMPYMGVGRNLAYRKELFFRNGGFKSHYNLASGDDDLFINEVANKENTTVTFHPQAAVKTWGKKNFKDWWWQKKRHFTTAPRYKLIHKIILALFPLSWFVMISTGTYLLFNPAWLLVTVLLTLRYTIQIAIFIGSSKSMGNRDIAWFSPVLEFITMLLNPIMYLSNVSNKPKTWK